MLFKFLILFFLTYDSYQQYFMGEREEEGSKNVYEMITKVNWIMLPFDFKQEVAKIEAGNENSDRRSK